MKNRAAVFKRRKSLTLHFKSDIICMPDGGLKYRPHHITFGRLRPSFFIPLV